ncbi:hypothetical protein EAI89_16450, partial [Eubacterium sp. am_0171]
LFLYSLTFGLTYVLKLFTYLCPETGQISDKMADSADTQKKSDDFFRRVLRIDTMWGALI